MSGAAQEPAGAAGAPPRLWGSDLLLHKVPLYAQARRYAATNPDDADAEGNTLGYGPSSYPLLAAVRACYNMVSQDDADCAITGNAAASVPLVDRAPFSGIDRAGYVHVPAQRKWGCAASPLPAESESSAALLRRTAAATVLDDAVGPATLAQVLEPWFGVVEDRLSAGAEQQLAEERERAALKKAKAREKAARQREQRGGGGVAANDSDDAEDGAVGDAVRLVDADGLRLRRRRRLYAREDETHGAVYTRLESALLHYSAATAEEREVLRATRHVGGDLAADAPVALTGEEVGGGNGVSGTALAPSSPEAWGGRMLSLVASAVAAEAGSKARRSDEEAEQQQKVLAYLKRVRWIAAQWGSTTNQMVLKDAGASTPSWGQMSEAQRVRAEMEHTQGQRRRFRRTRRSGDDVKGDDNVGEESG